jgi:hypothetical protein
MCSHLQQGSRYLLTRQWNQGRAICQTGPQSAASENTIEIKDDNREWNMKTDIPK